jgi:hypothetical protein
MNGVMHCEATLDAKNAKAQRTQRKFKVCLFGALCVLCVLRVKSCVIHSQP